MKLDIIKRQKKALADKLNAAAQKKRD